MTLILCNNGPPRPSARPRLRMMEQSFTQATKRKSRNRRSSSLMLSVSSRTTLGRKFSSQLGSVLRPVKRRSASATSTVGKVCAFNNCDRQESSARVFRFRPLRQASLLAQKRKGRSWLGGVVGFRRTWEEEKGCRMYTSIDRARDF